MVQVGPDFVFGRVLVEIDVDLGDDHILDLDDGDLLDITTDEHGGGCEAYEPAHQNRTSKPNVVSSGNMDTPDLVAGVRSYSKK